MSLIQNHFVPILHIHPQIIFHKKHSHFFLVRSSSEDFRFREFCDHPKWDWCLKNPAGSCCIPGHLVSTVESRTFDPGHVLDIEARHYLGGGWGSCDIPMIPVLIYIYIYGIGGSGIIWTYDIRYIPNTAHRHMMTYVHNQLENHVPENSSETDGR